MKITKIIETETGHRLTDYPSKCAHLHGHRYRWEVTVEAPELDAVGFVMDFGDLKTILKEKVEVIDHAFLFHNKDPLVLRLGEESCREMLEATNGQCGRLFFLDFNPTSENLVEWMAERINSGLQEEGFTNIQVKRIKMWETSSSYTVWNPEPKLNTIGQERVLYKNKS